MADDVIQIQNTGAPTQNIDNTSVVRPDGLVVDRQRVALKNDTSFTEPPLVERYMLEVIELLREIRTENRMQSQFLFEKFFAMIGAADVMEHLRRDNYMNDPRSKQVR